ncbi:CoB--CoM heterodisulfide reductase iron-sulfur subunit B family protein [bacterium]|nr:CoB--CoM heterodisulfide reductase iron-sulfur subunit B family protein [candidate division CSSED10-310 bacterium]
MKVGYFPGCSLTGSAKEFDISLREVLRALGVELQEIDDWSCCGASSAHVVSRVLATALPMRDLVLAEEQGIDRLLVPCAACYNRLICAQHEMQHDHELGGEVREALRSDAGGKVEILNIIELLAEIGTDALAARSEVKLGSARVACYYGCLLLRPHDITGFDDVEQPESMERLVKAIGAEPIQWGFKTECCGGAHSISHKRIVADLSKRIIDDARSNGANLVVVACPMCHTNLDMRQKEIRKHYPDHEELPVVYITELLGLALGIHRKKLGINLHFVKLPQHIGKAAS